MRKILLVIVVVLISSLNATAQSEPKLTKESVVRDSANSVLPYDTWVRLTYTGRYKIKPETKENGEFVIYRLSDEEYEKNLEAMPKPKESKFFATGKKFTHFKTTDINDNKVNTKSLEGKILVINYWFIKCPPCVMEIPELNKIADKYSADSSVVFIAVALDKKAHLQDFLKRTTFRYTIVDDGGFLADQYRITTYPTNLIVDQKGKVYFHSSGLAVNTAYWIDKSIGELKAKELQNSQAAAQ